METTSLGHAKESIITVHTEPNGGQNSTRENGEIPKVIPKARANGYREGNMIINSNISVQNSGQAVANSREENDQNGIHGTQSHEERCCPNSPAGDIDKVRKPIVHKIKSLPGL